MRYLQRAHDLADSRGYLRDPKVVALRDRVPDWFRVLATDTGLAEFESRRGFRVPAALREFYACPLLACFLEATMDGEVFLTDLATMTEGDLPPVVTWVGEPHLVFAFHSHSGMVFAAKLDADDPLVFCGFEDEPEPVADEERPPETFSAWVFSAVDGHEARLDYWQGVYEECRDSPLKAQRLGGVEWIRELPGMAQRLDRDEPE
jgi:hypothetical protein